MLSWLAVSIWSQSPFTAQRRTVLAVVFVGVLAGIGAALTSCSDEPATTASEPSVATPSADLATSTHPGPALTTSTELPPPTRAEPEPTPATEPPTPKQPEPGTTPTTQPEPEPTPTEPEPEPIPTTKPPATTLPAEPEPEPATDTELEQPVEGNDQTGSNDSAVSGETLEAADLGLGFSWQILDGSFVGRDGPRVLPWDDGYLQFGYPAAGDGWDPTRVLVRDSADGSVWSAYRPFPVPFEDLLAYGASRWPIIDVASDGQRLLFVVQGRHRIVVAITSDLIDWETVEIVPPKPDGLPHGVRAGTSATHLALGPNGWVLHTSTDLGVDLWELAPADIRDSAQHIEFGTPESQGLIVRWQTSEQEPAEPYHSRFVTWEELGIEAATYRHYGSAHFANKPYTPTELTSGAVWVASWGEAPVRTELPKITGGTCCQIVGTSAGYFALAELGEPGYPPILDVEAPMFFSPDGLNWVRRSPEPEQPGPFADAPCSSPTVVDQTLEALVADCEALWSFYKSQDSEELLGGSRGDTWGPDNPLETWRWVGVTDGRVTSLHFDHILFGPATLSADLGKLTALESLSGCNVEGPIPAELGNLTNLRVISIDTYHMCTSSLEGPIPPEIGELTNLEVLSFNRTSVDGPIPPELGELTNLTQLHLGGNRLSGPIPPELGNLTNLTHMYLCYNNLTGPIPAELANLTNLPGLYLNGNSLTGPIPAELTSLTNLGRLYLQGNNLTGPIPAELQHLTKLFDLNLSHNGLTGPIPLELLDLTLTRMDLSGNDLTGPIPPELGGLGLVELYIGGNDLTGPIPPELGGLTNLVALDLSDNGLSGPIPAELTNLTELWVLQLHDNYLSGPPPAGLADLPSLVVLSLDGNELLDPVPDELLGLDQRQDRHLELLFGQRWRQHTCW